MATQHGVENVYGTLYHGYSHDDFHHDYTTQESYESPDLVTVESAQSDQKDKGKENISPKVRVKLLSILIVLVLLLGAVALEVVIDFWMNIGFMNKAREFQFQGLGRANHAMPFAMDPEVVMSIISSVR